MRIVSLLLLALVSLFLAAPATCLAWSGRVLELENALFMTVDRDGEQQTVRVYGIFVNRPSHPLGKRAEEYSREMLLGREATFREIKSTPKFLAAVVSQDETVINEELVRMGLAWVDPAIKHTPYGLTLLTIQGNAMKQKVGIWDKNKKWPVEAVGRAGEGGNKGIAVMPRKPLLTF